MSNDTNDLRNPSDHIPLSPQEFQVLLVLCRGRAHGYGIVKATEDESGRSILDLGTLYRTISRMVTRGLIEAAPGGDAESKRRRRYYQATEFGRRVARAEALRLKQLVDSESASILLEQG